MSESEKWTVWSGAAKAGINHEEAPHEKVAPAVTAEPRMPMPEEFGLTWRSIGVIESLWHNGAVTALCFLLIAWAAFSSKILSIWWGPYILLVLTVLVGVLAQLSVNKERRQVANYRQAQKTYSAEFERKREQQRALEAARQQELEKQRAELRKKMVWWNALDGRSFEIELASLLEGRGYKVTLTQASNDGGIDLILHRNANPPILVQCKAHAVPISVGLVREFFGAIEHYGTNKYSDSWIVSKTGYTREATRFVEGKRIKLLTIQELI